MKRNGHKAKGYEVEEEIRRAVAEEIKKELREHWTEYNTTKAPDWVRATISGTQEDIERLLGISSGGIEEQENEFIQKKR